MRVEEGGGGGGLGVNVDGLCGVSVSVQGRDGVVGGTGWLQLWRHGWSPTEKYLQIYEKQGICMRL
jgi:hypothetical protein